MSATNEFIFGATRADLRRLLTAPIKTMDDYERLIDAAEEDYEGFWSTVASSCLDWKQPFSVALDETRAPFYQWFADGTLNASVNCLDRHVANGNGQRTAIVFESDGGEVEHVTYANMLQRVCRFANALRERGVGCGDRVIIYMPMSIEAIVAMQACARIGATHSVVFGGFSAKALHERVVDVGAVTIVTADEQMRGGRALPLKSIVDEALEMGGCECVRHVIVYQRTGARIAWNPSRDAAMDAVCAGQADVCEPEWVNAEHPLFVLYTSGSTGKPKGVQHCTAGYLAWAAQSMKWTFGLSGNDVFWCTADVGWITGHTYIAYGPFLLGMTQVVFEGIPTFPSAARFWEMVERHRVSVFYTAPTAIRSLMKASASDSTVHPDRFDLSSLRLLGTVGEPINPDAWTWYQRHIGAGKCPVIDTWWQTETGGQMIAPLPGVTPLVPGSCTLPLPGIDAAIVDETGAEVPDGQGGLLVIRRPWPSMVRTIWGNPERYQKGYFPDELGGHVYLAGDGAIRDRENGYFTITGRIDDVLNISGHRLGTVEIERALASHPMVAEAAVVGRPDAMTGEAVVAFVMLKESIPDGSASKALANELRTWVGREIGGIAKPKDIRFGENLPKTRSGKIMRRLLRSIARNEPIVQDTSTLENPAILKQFSECN